MSSQLSNQIRLQNELYYDDGTYIVFKMKRGFIIYNTLYNFSEKHTHIRTLNTAKFIISCVINKKIPQNVNRYVLSCMVRISDDELYIKKVNELIKSKNKKSKQSYRNKTYKKTN